MLELSASGLLIQMTPTGGDTSARIAAEKCLPSCSYSANRAVLVIRYRMALRPRRGKASTAPASING